MYDNPLNQMPGRPAPPPGAHVPHASHAPGAGAPYAAGFGPQPYAPPAFDYQPVPVYEEEGSYGLGMALGICFGFIVLIIVMLTAKPQTKRGAAHGFIGKICAVFALVAFAAIFS